MKRQDSLIRPTLTAALLACALATGGAYADQLVPTESALPAGQDVAVEQDAPVPELDARMIVREAIDYWRDTSSDADVQMVIHRPSWERKLEFRSITKGSDKAVVRVISPKRDAGSATLLVGNRMWSYSPQVNRVIQIPSSMMQQNWMGSDYTNSDIAKSDQVVESYEHRLIAEEENDGQRVHVIEAMPHAEAAVVWGREVLY
ncbi:MAG: outer membrane lipoprotein-sorting protein, partial [Gammaproteobacteria bacterium]